MASVFLSVSMPYLSLFIDLLFFCYGLVIFPSNFQKLQKEFLQKMIFLKVCSKVCKKWTLLESRCKLCKLDSSQLGISGFTFRTVAGEDVLKDPVHSFCPLDPVISPGTGLSLFEHFEVFG